MNLFSKIALIGKNVSQYLVIDNFKRDKTIVLFGSWFGKTFSDNSRFLFQYLASNKEKYNLTHVVWVTREKSIYDMMKSKDYEVYMMNSPESIYYHKKAAYHIICNQSNYNSNSLPDIMVEYSTGAVKVNLWHGAIAIKTVNYASKEHKDYERKHPYRANISKALNSLKIYRNLSGLGGWNNCNYLCTSEYSKYMMSEFFPLPNTNYILSSYPRVNKCLKYMDNEIDIINRIKNKKVILYLPTFRSNEVIIKEPTSDNRFIELLEKNELVWMTKKHEADKGSHNPKNSDFVVNLPSNFDINILLPYISAVISDYSSVVWDATYFRKPVFYYIPDYTSYRDNDRGFMMTPDEFLIGDAAYSVDELIHIINKYKDDFTVGINKNIEKIRGKIWQFDADYNDLWEKITALKG